MKYTNLSGKEINLTLKISTRSHILKNYKKDAIKTFCYENKIRRRGTKQELVERIYQKFGDDCLLNGLWKPVIDTTLFGTTLNDIDQNQIDFLKREISNTIQHACLNFTTNNIFGIFNLTTFLKIFYIPKEISERSRNGWHSLNLTRLQNGRNIKELWLVKTFQNNFRVATIPFIFNSILKKEYIHYETNYFDKNTNLFLKEKPRHWKCSLIQLEIQYNIERQMLMYSTLWVRQSFNETENKWEERC
jgi:hypothetical protein